MTPQVSILLPTIRPHLIRRAVESIALAAGTVSYEIVVVADFPLSEMGCTSPVAHLHCHWIRHPRRGVVDAVQVACAAAQGEYWFLLNDESTLDPGAIEILYHEAVKAGPAVLTPRHLPAFPFQYYGIAFAAFPFAHRDVILQVGGLLDPTYKGFYADPDFSLRAVAQGIPIRTVDGAVIRHTNKHDAPHQASVSAYLEADRATFRYRWDHLGEFRDP